MKKIFDGEILDIIPYASGFIFAEKIALSNKKIKVSYTAYSFDTSMVYPVTKGAYLLTKYGGAFKAISNQLSNYVTCDAGQLPDRQIIIVYPQGEAGIFNQEGELTWFGSLTYHDFPVQSVIVDGKYFWCAVPQGDAVIRYNTRTMKMDLRIGGGSNSCFQNPNSMSLYDGKLYVCDVGTCKVRVMHLQDYTVKDFLKFDVPVFKYMRMGKNEVVVREDGVYYL